MWNREKIFNLIDLYNIQIDTKNKIIKADASLLLDFISLHKEYERVIDELGNIRAKNSITADIIETKRKK